MGDIMLLLCVKIFFARLLDVSIATYRTMVMVKGKKVFPAILGFFEVLIWFMVVQESINTKIDSLWIPVSYAAGYAIGSLLGSYLSGKFIKGVCAVQVITDKSNQKLLNAIKKSDFGVSIIELKKEKNIPKKELYLIEVNSNRVKELKNLVNQYDEKAFIIVSDSKFTTNGYIR